MAAGVTPAHKGAEQGRQERNKVRKRGVRRCTESERTKEIRRETDISITAYKLKPLRIVTKVKKFVYFLSL